MAARVIRKQRKRFGEGALFLVALSAMLQIYMVLKVAIPHFVPFYADPFLADWDSAIFSRDPWRITHSVFGPTATRFLDWFYATPCGLATAGLTLWACFTPDRAFSHRAVLAIMLCWFLIGTWAALLLSSAGPVYYENFYGDPRFAELVALLSPDLTAVKAQQYLLDNFGNAGFGLGISAMPSMHNALYLLFILMIYDRFGNGWQMWLAIVFEATVFVASVHLGWHYAVDAIVSATLVWPIWALAGLVQRWEPPAGISANQYAEPAPA